MVFGQGHRGRGGLGEGSGGPARPRRGLRLALRASGGGDEGGGGGGSGNGGCEEGSNSSSPHSPFWLWWSLLAPFLRILRASVDGEGKEEEEEAKKKGPPRKRAKKSSAAAEAASKQGPSPSSPPVPVSVSFAAAADAATAMLRCVSSIYRATDDADGRQRAALAQVAGALLPPAAAIASSSNSSLFCFFRCSGSGCEGRRGPARLRAPLLRWGPARGPLARRVGQRERRRQRWKRRRR